MITKERKQIVFFKADLFVYITNFKVEFLNRLI